MKKFILAGLAGILLLTLMIITTHFVQAEKTEPDRPAWVDRNGILDMSKVPDCINVLDSKGDNVKDKNTGKDVCIPKDQVFDLPSSDKVKPVSGKPEKDPEGNDVYTVDPYRPKAVEENK